MSVGVLNFPSPEDIDLAATRSDAVFRLVRMASDLAAANRNLAIFAIEQGLDPAETLRAAMGVER